MIDTDKYEDLRLLISEFNDGPMGSADDFAWRRHLETYESLLAEVKRLQKAYEVMGEYLREIGLDYCEHCLRVYSDISDEVLYRHREERCLT